MTGGRAFLDAEMSEAILLQNQSGPFLLKVEAILTATNSTKHLLFGDPIKFHVGFRGPQSFATLTSYRQRFRCAEKRDMTWPDPISPKNTGSPPSICQKATFLWRMELWRGKFDMSMLSSVPELKNFTKKTKKLKDNTVDSPTSDRHLQLSVPHYLLRVPTSLTSVFYAPSRAISIDILKRQLLQVMATISTWRSIFSFKANLCIHIHLGNTWRIHFSCFRTLPCYLEAQGEQLVKKGHW